MIVHKYSMSLTILSVICGWVYCLAWSLSFYPQLVLNHKLQNMSMMSMDFVVLNILGFFSYTLYNGIHYFTKDNIVTFNDFLFSAHALSMTLILGLQTIIYPQRRLVHYTIHSFIILILGSLLTAWYYFMQQPNTLPVLLKLLGSIKLCVSLIKYIPQAWLHLKRKSTQGWNVWNNTLDMVGGVFSVVQEVLDGNKNAFKLALGFVSIGFDLVFVFQHYVLYNDSKTKLTSHEPLLDDYVSDPVLII